MTATRARDAAHAPRPRRTGSDPFRQRARCAGLAAGALTTTTSANGPPLLLYLLERRVGRGQDARHARVPVHRRSALIGLAALAVGAADLSLPDGAVAAALPVAAAAGHVAGRPLFARLAEGHYERVVTVLLVVSVVTGAVVALA